MDIVFIKDLKVDTTIGVYDWERSIKQQVHIDLEMGYGISQAAATDELQYTLNYQAVSERIIEFVQQSEFKLIETMAEQIAGIVLQEFAVPWLALTLSKPGAVPQASSVGVRIERGCR